MNVFIVLHRGEYKVSDLLRISSASCCSSSGAAEEGRCCTEVRIHWHLTSTPRHLSPLRQVASTLEWCSMWALDVYPTTPVIFEAGGQHARVVCCVVCGRRPCCKYRKTTLVKGIEAFKRTVGVRDSTLSLLLLAFGQIRKGAITAPKCGSAGVHGGVRERALVLS
jgi:hypothetical protein